MRNYYFAFAIQKQKAARCGGESRRVGVWQQRSAVAAPAVDVSVSAREKASFPLCACERLWPSPPSPIESNCETDAHPASVQFNDTISRFKFISRRLQLLPHWIQSRLVNWLESVSISECHFAEWLEVRTCAAITWCKPRPRQYSFQFCFSLRALSRDLLRSDDR